MLGKRPTFIHTEGYKSNNSVVVKIVSDNGATNHSRAQWVETNSNIAFTFYYSTTKFKDLFRENVMGTRILSSELISSQYAKFAATKTFC